MADLGFNECLIGVYWSGRGDDGDDGRGHLLMRGRVSADLGLERVPDPPFTDAEMQRVAHAAKMAALKCLAERGTVYERKRRRTRRRAPGLPSSAADHSAGTGKDRP